MTVRELFEELLRYELDDEVNVEVIDPEFCDIYEVRGNSVSKTPILVIK